MTDQNITRNSTQMGHPPHHQITKTTLLKTLFLTVFSAQGHAGETTQASASTGLLCISECVTCPVICSPPPSPPQAKLHPPPSSSPSPPPPASPKPPKHASPSPPPPRTPPPPRFIYSFGGVPPPPQIIYGVLPAPPNEKGKPKDYEYPYPYDSGASCLSQMVAVFVLQTLLIRIVM